MPMKNPNPEFFKPILPKHPRLHNLFGTKFFKNHRFNDNSLWSPYFKTLQYSQMSHLLRKNNELKRLEKIANKRQLVDELNILKQECMDGRIRLKNALQGDQQIIQNLLIDNTELRRLYSKMPIQEAVSNIDQRTFVKRRERDRLQYELNSLMNIYEKKLIEKSQLEDRIAFEADFMLPEEFEVTEWRKSIKNGQTRIKALKAIQRAYHKICSILLHDSIYYEPVLESLENDVAEQANFIDHVILLGIPGMEKSKFLKNQLKHRQTKTMSLVQENMKILAKYKIELTETSENVKKTVRLSGERNLKMRVFIRETPSMYDLRQNLEDIERNIKTLQTELCSNSPKTLHLKIKQLENQNKDLANQYKFSEQLLEIYADNMKLAEGQVKVLKNNNTDEQIERVNHIEELKDQIKLQKKIQDNENAKIKKNNDNLMLFTTALNNLTQVLNRFGSKSSTPLKKYPTKVLNLPLLDFDKRPTVKPPDKQIEDVYVLMSIVLEKLESFYGHFTRMGGVERAAKIANEMRFDSLIRTTSGLFSDDDDHQEAPMVILEDDEKDHPSVPNRKMVKDESARIVLERAKKEWEL